MSWSSAFTLRVRTVALAVGAAVAVFVPLQSVTAQLITFPSSDFLAGSSTPIPVGYGSTVGVATSYRALDAFGDATDIGIMRWWDVGHGGLNGVAYGVNAAGSVAEVGLRNNGSTAPVTLRGFDIASWAGRSRTLFVRVLGWDYTPVYELEAPIGADYFSFASYLAGLGFDAPARDDGFRIQWTQDQSPTTPDITGRGAYDAGIDNIGFEGGAGVVVPEPAPGVLLALALIMLPAARLVRKWRRSLA